jgi:hypothetical protein
VAVAGIGVFVGGAGVKVAVGGAGVFVGPAGVGVLVGAAAVGVLVEAAGVGVFVGTETVGLGVGFGPVTSLLQCPPTRKTTETRVATIVQNLRRMDPPPGAIVGNGPAWD